MDLKISPRTVQQETVRMVREAITNGFFKPGERLVEAKLCSLLGVSRTSVREALRVLATEKLVTIVPNKGPSVTELSLQDALDIYRVRALLEGEAAALAATRARPEQLQWMRKALDAFIKAVENEDSQARLSATSEFYEAIIESSGNAVLGEVLNGLITRINVLRAKTMARPGRTRRSVQELERIYVALENADADAAREAAIQHVNAAKAEACEVYQSMAPANWLETVTPSE